VSDCYRVNMARLTCREVWRWKRPFLFAGFVLRKALGLPLFAPDLVFQKPGIIVLEPEQVRDDLRRRMGAIVQDMLATGFHMVFYYRAALEDVDHVIGAALLDEARRTIGIVTCVVVPAEDAGFSLISRRRGGRFVATGDGGRVLAPPPEIDAVSLRGKSVREVAAAHDRRLQALPPPMAITKEDVEDTIVDVQRVTIAHSVRRGVWVPAA
jgi:hypothetical protein